MKTSDLHLADDCSCQPGVPYADGTMPLYVSDVKMAYMNYKLYSQRDAVGEVRYWGVHYNGKHVLGIV